jgi:hypothetical protein
MSFRIIRASIAAEQTNELHEARLLLLLSQAPNGIEGITKLAKMDFLLRYPRHLERLIKKERRRPVKVPMHDFERDTVESKMIRFRYGPWDARYRSWIALLSSMSLITSRTEGANKVILNITEKGRTVAAQLAQLPEFQNLAARAGVVCDITKNLNGTRLKDLIYEVVPELNTMSWGQEIAP